MNSYKKIFSILFFTGAVLSFSTASEIVSNSKFFSNSSSNALPLSDSVKPGKTSTLIFYQEAGFLYGQSMIDLYYYRQEILEVSGDASHKENGLTTGLDLKTWAIFKERFLLNLSWGFYRLNKLTIAKQSGTIDEQIYNIFIMKPLISIKLKTLYPGVGYYFAGGSDSENFNQQVFITSQYHMNSFMFRLLWDQPVHIDNKYLFFIPGNIKVSGLWNPPYGTDAEAHRFDLNFSLIFHLVYHMNLSMSYERMFSIYEKDGAKETGMFQDTLIFGFNYRLLKNFGLRTLFKKRIYGKNMMPGTVVSVSAHWSFKK